MCRIGWAPDLREQTSDLLIVLNLALHVDNFADLINFGIPHHNGLMLRVAAFSNVFSKMDGPT
jgi:hypothetical protein